ncbi:hypothetical protein KGMB02707_17800 [Mesosutterella multiformis]|nr:hypothetical protein KGMB02707_17800 [Mesosutterella multiformis]
MNRTGRPTGRPRGGTNHDPKIREKLLKLFQEGEENFVGDSEIIALGGASNETKDRPLG